MKRRVELAFAFVLGFAAGAWAGCDARVVDGGACGSSVDCPEGFRCLSGNCERIPGNRGDGSNAPRDIDAPFDGSAADVESGPDVFSDVGGDTTADAAVGADSGPDGGNDVGPDVFVKDMCTGSRPDGGVMDVTPSCGPSPTGKGGDACKVPGGAFWMGANHWDCPGNAGCFDFEPLHQVFVPSFQMDRFEVIVREYAECVNAGVCTLPECDCLPADTCLSNSEIPGREDHPVNCVDWFQASTFCWWAGKRLPSEAEWEKAARGTDLRAYPWGNEPADCDRAVQNATRCGYTSTATVGSKPLGASPYGVLDLAGNVAEWTADEYMSRYYSTPADGSPYSSSLLMGHGDGPPHVCRGGYWDLPAGALDALMSTDRHYCSAGVWLGFRCVVSGDESPDRRFFTASPGAPQTVTAASEGEKEAGGRSSAPAPDSANGGTGFVCGASPTGRGGDMCDVPEGAFPMGCTPIEGYDRCEIFTDEVPLHEVRISDFKIDKFEVTAGEYRECVKDGACGLPGNVNFVCNERCTYGVEGKENHPINCVRWEQARDCCAWAGKRLPTEAEWEKAAAGPDGWVLPWGDNPFLDVCDYAVEHWCYPDYAPWGVEPVGTKPRGASPYGALDMIGNVWEWTNDWYDENYYANSPAADPPGPPAGQAHVLRGGSREYRSASFDNKSRLAVFHPAYWSETVGFRCAY